MEKFLTVGELRKRLEGVSDTMLVTISVSDDENDTGYFAKSAEEIGHGFDPKAVEDILKSADYPKEHIKTDDDGAVVISTFEISNEVLE